MSKVIPGQRFGKLEALYPSSDRKQGCIVWRCSCKCGKLAWVSSAKLNRGQKSCGCLVKKHNGMSYERPYRIWSDMLSRCNNDGAVSYKYYGGRGIRVCKRWFKFKNFWKDMSDGYKDEFVLDRINNNGDYEKTNCRWTTSQKNGSNKRNNVYITYGGQKRTVAEWSRILNIKDGTIRSRIIRGKNPICEKDWKSIPKNF